MQLDAQRLKALITQAGYKNAKLARELGVSPKTVGRWTKGTTTPPESTIHKIAETLNVPIEVLTGREPMEEPKRAKASPRRIGADVSTRTRNAFLLATGKYGVTQTQIIELAPLLFTLVAEGSLDYRRQIVRDAELHVDALNEIASGLLSYLRSHRAEEVIFFEEESIQNRDIFGQRVSADAYELGNYQPTENPFFRYLHELVGALTDNDVVRLEEIEDTYVEYAPQFSMFHEEARKIADGDSELADLIAQGTVDLGKLPKELHKADAREARAKWLKQEAQRVQDKARKSFFEKFGLDI